MKKITMKNAWIIIVLFFVLGFFVPVLGILGFACMGTPILQALLGKGKIHCQKHCPRGSFLGKFLKKYNLGLTMPKWMRSRGVKHALLITMITMLLLGFVHADFTLMGMAHVLYRLMGMSFILGIVMGLTFTPRSWCVVCPMGHATGLIKDIKLEVKSCPGC